VRPLTCFRDSCPRRVEDSLQSQRKLGQRERGRGKSGTGRKPVFVPISNLP
jgi:transposase-like protein